MNLPQENSVFVDDKEISIISTITDLIKIGLKNGYKQNLNFTQNYSDLQSKVIEYLIVVNTAQQLEKFCFDNSIRINLEYSLNDFYNNAFSSVVLIGDCIFNQTLSSRTNHAPKDSKSKRLDIVLTQEKSDNRDLASTLKSFVGIEIKAINQHHTKIKKDVRRLSTAMGLVDAVGENNIMCCFCCFFRRLDCNKSIISRTEISGGIEKERLQWEDYFKNIVKDFPQLDYELIDLNIVNSPVDDIGIEPWEQDIDYDELVERSGFVNGYIIKITRRIVTDKQFLA